MAEEKKIQILPDFIANQIAAGEVVQRPESVVKELVENALDAGADQIAVIVRGAGKKLIHIVDNGKGMNSEDLELAVKRHATSKIVSQEDLEAIKSFGFRGEALASISSVAFLELRSRRSGDDHGMALVSEPMKGERMGPCNMDEGTQVYVKNLFYNVPARRKFLRSNLTEFRYISDTMTKFALAHPEVHFTFYDEDNLVFDVHKASLKDRVGDVLGHDKAKALVPVNFDHNYIKIAGFVGLPELARKTRAGQYLYLNRRSILSKSINHAIHIAFERLLEPKTFPFYLLNLTIDPAQVDINVHPQKHEVKFEDERMVYNLVNMAVNRAMQNYNMVPDLSQADFMSQSPIEEDKPAAGSSGIMLVNKMTGEVFGDDSFSKIGSEHQKREYTGIQARFYAQGRGGFRPSYKDTPAPSAEFTSAYDQMMGKGSVSGPDNSMRFEFDKGEETRIMTIGNGYILSVSGLGLTITDQRNAHKRILYEKALKMFSNSKPLSQQLLFPVEINLTNGQLAALGEYGEDLVKIGFEYELEGKGPARLTAVPAGTQSGGERECFTDILDIIGEYNTGGQGRVEAVAMAYCRRMAMKHDYKPGRTEAENLIEELNKCNSNTLSPDGKRIFKQISIAEIKSFFA